LKLIDIFQKRTTTVVLSLIKQIGTKFYCVCVYFFFLSMLKNETTDRSSSFDKWKPNRDIQKKEKEKRRKRMKF